MELVAPLRVQIPPPLPLSQIPQHFPNKQMKIKHILDTTKKEDKKELVLTHTISADCNEIFESADSVDNWDNIRHITDSLYYVWDDGLEKDGAVVVGKYK